MNKIEIASRNWAEDYITQHGRHFHNILRESFIAGFKKGISLVMNKQCNKCKYYYGVHDCPGHAPCTFWNIGGVMYNDYCSRFEEGERCEQ